MSTSPDDTFERVAGSLPAVTGDELDQLLARSAHVSRNAICITDADLDEPGPRIVYVNPAFEQMTGHRAADVVGRTPRMLQGPATDRRVLDRLRADLEAGRPFQGETVNYRRDGTPFPMAWRIAAVRAADGTITHYVAAQDDMSQLRTAEQQLRDDADAHQADADWLGHLVDLAVRLARSPSATAVLDEVVATGTGRLGVDTVTVLLADPERGDHWVPSARGPAAPAVGARFAADPGDLIHDVLERGSPRFESAATRPVGAGMGPPTGGVAVLPFGDHEVYGVLVLSWTRPRAFRPVERNHLGLLARLATMTHRQTAALESQRWLAGQLQAALLPRLPDLPGLETAWRYQAVADHTDVGGDWYDAVRLADGNVALTVGDVSGHGAQAAALMGELRFTTRGLLRATSDPATLLDELDAALHETRPAGTAVATVCALVLQPDGELRYCAAGHPAPVIRRVDGSVDVLDDGRTRLLGAGAGGPRRTAATAHLGDGDVLVAFSDGAFESRARDYDEGYHDLLDRLRAAPPEPDALCEAALGPDEGATAGRFRDDVVVLATRRAPSPPPAGA